MVRIKSRYRKMATGGSVDVSVDTPQTHVEADKSTEQLMNAKEAASVSVEDSASSAFQQQIDNLRQAENLQRQKAAPMPDTREGRIVHWRNQGYSQDQAEYFNQLKEHPEVTHQAVLRARQSGLADESSQEFHDKVRANFQLLNGIDPVDVKLDDEPSLTANELPKPAPAKRVVDRGGSEPLGASMYAAPVSRETLANGSYNSYGERPGQVRLYYRT
jgi:hypothetical protein